MITRTSRILTVFGFLVITSFLWIQRKEILAVISKEQLQKAKHGSDLKDPIFDASEILFDFFDHTNEISHAPSNQILPEDCTMASCFSHNQCTADEFRVFVYPESEPVSPIYNNILLALKRSRYYTDKPDEACLFVLGLDTIDRDVLSDLFVKNLNDKMRLDPLLQQFWNGGRNHVIFNLYSGTFPDYVENDLGFDIGYAILAKASMSTSVFRHGFDVSLPLFHNSLSVRGEDSGFSSKSSRFPDTTRKYLLSFKGKRYLYGIGSDSRNFLYHIHNNRDIIILTTCLHGKQSKMLRDKRCDLDDQEYNRYDYQMLLDNTTFCLVPRGRRLGSFRFLETLQAGCIPIVLSNGWVLPFSEIIDWKLAILQADERLLTQLPSLVRSIGSDRIMAMRQQSQLLWRQYFSSIERIVLTSMEIIRNRLSPIRRSRDQWNTWPAISMSLMPYLQYTEIDHDFEHNVKMPRTYQDDNFTAIITQTHRHNIGTSFVRLLKVLNRLPYVQQVIVISPWREASVQAIKGWTWLRVPVITISSEASPSDMISLINQNIPTNCITLLYDDCDSTWEELEFGFVVWKSHPERLVGFHAASHHWDEFHGAWRYSTKLTNEYSMVSSKDSFFHVQYYRLLWHHRLRVMPYLNTTCSHILLNFIVSSVTRQPAMKMAGKGVDVCTKTRFDACLEEVSEWNSCLNKLADFFGYMPLVRSRVARNPVLYKDNVSVYRKKYRHLEKI